MTPPRYIPADLLPGVLEGWVGKTASACRNCGGTNIRYTCSWCGDSTFDHECNDGCKDCGGRPRSALDTNIPAVRDHLARVMAAAGKPIWHLTRAEQDGTISAEESAGAVAWSVLSVARGVRLRGPTSTRVGGLTAAFAVQQPAPKVAPPPTVPPLPPATPCATTTAASPSLTSTRKKPHDHRHRRPPMIGLVLRGLSRRLDAEFPRRYRVVHQKVTPFFDPRVETIVYGPFRSKFYCILLANLVCGEWDRVVVENREISS